MKVRMQGGKMDRRCRNRQVGSWRASTVCVGGGMLDG